MDACCDCLPWQNPSVQHSLISSDEDLAKERFFTGITAGQESLRYHIPITTQNSSQNKAFYVRLQSFPTPVLKARTTSHPGAPDLHHQSHSPPTSQLASSSLTTRSKRQCYTLHNLSQLEKENLSTAKFNPTQPQPVSHVLLHSLCKSHFPLFLVMSGFQEWGEPSHINSEYWITLYSKSGSCEKNVVLTWL